MSLLEYHLFQYILSRMQNDDRTSNGNAEGASVQAPRSDVKKKEKKKKKQFSNPRKADREGVTIYCHKSGTLTLTFRD